jgi:hypothetical protein
MSAIKNDYFDEITRDLESYDLARATAAWANASQPRVDVLAALDAYATPAEFRGYLRLTLVKLLLDDADYDNIALATKNYLQELKK